MSKKLPPTDEELVASLAARDDGALAQLYDRHGRCALALARRIVGDAGLAEDAVQEAFLGVWREAERYAPERAAARTWLLMVVRRRAIDALRRERRRQEGVAQATPAAAPPAADEAWARLQRERVRGALAVLPSAQRELLALAYYGGLSQSEIATRLGQPLGTVKSRTFGALGELRGVLESL